MNDQIITSEDDPEDKLAKVWETICGDFLESVFSDWMSRLKWVTKLEGEYYSNPHFPNRNYIDSSLDQ
jgi:hypothetical protein